MLRSHLLLSCVVGLSMVSTAARADVVSIGGGGTYVYHDGVAIRNVPFSVSFSYDTAAPVVSSFPDQAMYGAMSFTMTVNLLSGTWTDTTSNAQIAVFSGQYADQFQITSEQNPDAPLFRDNAVVFYKIELSGIQTIFANTSLPASVVLTDWSTAKAVVYSSSPLFGMNSNLTTLGPASVPEPASFASVLGGVALFGAAFRRASRKRG